jgi:hypothetical protein
MNVFFSGILREAQVESSGCHGASFMENTAWPEQGIAGNGRLRDAQPPLIIVYVTRHNNQEAVKANYGC